MILRLGIYLHVFFGMIFLTLFPPTGILFLCIRFIFLTQDSTEKTIFHQNMFDTVALGEVAFCQF